MSAQCPHYKVDYSKDLVRVLKGLGERARRLGFAKTLGLALREIVDHLEKEPAAWGTPGLFFKALGLQKYTRQWWVLRVTYAVDEDRCLVYLLDIKPRRDHPLSTHHETNGAA